MGKFLNRVGCVLVEPDCDRNANKVEVRKCPDGYHIDFRNLQVKLNKEQFERWKEALNVAYSIVKNEMEGDI